MSTGGGVEVNSSSRSMSGSGSFLALFHGGNTLVVNFFIAVLAPEIKSIMVWYYMHMYVVWFHVFTTTSRSSV